MTELIACLSTGKGTWAHVADLIKSENWEKVILITNEFGKEKFTADNASYVLINPDNDVEKIREDIKLQLSSLVSGTQVAVNFVSGGGKEHMALISALLQLGLGIRFVVSSDSGMSEV